MSGHDETRTDPIEPEVPVVEPIPAEPEGPPRRTNLRPVQVAVLVLVALVLIVLQLRSFGGSGQAKEPGLRTEPAITNQASRQRDTDVFGSLPPASTDPLPAIPIVAPRYNWAAMAARDPMLRLTASSSVLGRRAIEAEDDLSDPLVRAERLWKAAYNTPPEPAPEPSLVESPKTERESQADSLEDFLGGQLQGREPIKARWLPQSSPYVLEAGTHIPSVLLTQMNTDLPSQIQARVMVPIYDSPTGTIEILPAGTRLVGVLDHKVVLGQRAALVTWDRAYLPDGSRLLLADEPGSGPLGDGGVRGRVHNHYGRLYMNTLLIALAGAGFQVSQERDGIRFSDDPTQVAGAAVAQEFFRTADQVLQEQLRFLKPTLVKDVGDRLLVTVTRDYVFERPWR